MKKSSLERALLMMGQENKGMLSKGVLPAGFWTKREAYALKELLLKAWREHTQFQAQRHAQK